ncbi:MULTISPECIES: adenylyl-sulfate kinase [Brevibacillus]|uniref:Adenylyl-sulfate kinase n=1 Tax=Brevibacillus brevis (strain 47 / JCM 6285 / NBRC 100599) TaxID=358681 RepID=C0ZHW8_BREBN|nr:MULTISPECIES: adenylyl-sulfate kinase [Bacillales]OUQ88297.1 adenylyl-sulfate kinase [Brevibacillus brevis]TQR33310.1 adenylyl-sulfate kinase [Lysinibacillus sp. SDF0063]UIO41111.1 adenylyl-sulfate kinase [Brevibacillus brevis]WGV58626.1 adenylyl-sulfate kinase [Brevibacillus brevis]BAH45242.1 adenylylsulfate kinase [Brevibacillus brevis NBRC 100599]
MSREGTANIVWHPTTITKQDRQKRAGHKSCVLWFTGLSGAGKSSLANAVEHELHQRGLASYVLDGDNIRHGLNRGLGFGAEDRQENIRRIGEVAKLFVDAGVITLTAFISPYREDRELARNLVEAGEFIEVYVKCSLDECERRDVKGLYRKARSGEIGQFTGISAPYEEPLRAELVIESDKQTIEESVQMVLTYLEELKIL